MTNLTQTQSLICQFTKKFKYLTSKSIILKEFFSQNLFFPTVVGIVTFTISNTKLQVQNPENLSNQQLKD